MAGICTLSSADAEFRLQRRGEETGTVFVHGFGGDLSVWDEVWDRLPADFAALRYDLRGFGESTAKNDKPFSHTDDLAAILDSLGSERVDLVGVSMGGAIAVNFALNHPQRVNKLALISPALVAWEWSDQWRALWRPLVEHARNGEMDKARQCWWRHPLFDITRQTPAAQKLHDSIMAYSGRHWIHDNQRRELPDVERIHRLTAPTLLLTGERDMQDFRLVADLLEASVPYLQRVHFPGLGHSLQLEDPAGVTRQLLLFLGQD